MCYNLVHLQYTILIFYFYNYEQIFDNCSVLYQVGMNLYKIEFKLDDILHFVFYRIYTIKHNIYSLLHNNDQ